MIILGILASNALAFALAYWNGWSMLTLLWPYWAQSVAIGWYARRRILSAPTFSTKGLLLQGETVEATEATRRLAVNGFGFNYGLFHLLFLLFLIAASWGGVRIEDGPVIRHVPLTGFDVLAICGIALGFALSLEAAYQRERRVVNDVPINLSTLIVIPYLRLVPFLVSLILGFGLGGYGGLLLFCGLRTIADVAAYVLEAGRLRGDGLAINIE